MISRRAVCEIGLKKFIKEFIPNFKYYKCDEKAASWQKAYFEEIKEYFNKLEKGIIRDVDISDIPDSLKWFFSNAKATSMYDPVSRIKVFMECLGILEKSTNTAVEDPIICWYRFRDDGWKNSKMTLREFISLFPDDPDRPINSGVEVRFSVF